jgi:hypothetical protein
VKLELESGDVYEDVTEADVVEAIDGEGFAILGDDPMTYIQCARNPEDPSEYFLEYQDKTLDQHFRAIDRPVTIERVRAAFTRYLRKDPSWKRDFEWEQDEPVE